MDEGPAPSSPQMNLKMGHAGTLVSYLGCLSKIVQKIGFVKATFE
jgi:hypothetical protein